MGETLASRRAGLDAPLAAAIVEAAPVIVLVLGPEGSVAYANPYFEALAGRKLADFRGLDWFSTFLLERDRDRTRALFSTSLAEAPARGSVTPSRAPVRSA